MKATVGRIVHFYDTSLAGVREITRDGKTINLNGQEAGPYPAVVAQTFDTGEYINLKVMAWGGDWAEGSVSEKSGAETGMPRYWVWPPRE